MKTFLPCLLLLASFVATAQTETNTTSKVPGRTAFYAELGGPGILFSANIDSRFKPTPFGWGFRAGLGFVTADEEVSGPYGPEYETRSVVTVPAQINYIFGKPNSVHTFEVGAGLTYVSKELDILNYTDENKTNLFATTSFMYRRQPKDGGFMWRIGFTPLIANGYIQPSAAVGVGYSF
jgi:hypothetical protein